MAKTKVYRRVCDYLKQAIASGDMKLGDAIYSENQLCDMLGVSRTSVRRAIREMVEDNILESRQGVGTFVKGINPSCTICLVNHYTRVLRYSTVDTYYTDFIYGAEGEASRENVRFQIFSGVIRNESDISGRMSHLNADGLILDGNFQDHFADLRVFQKHFPNMVVLDGDPSHTTLPSVSPDLEPGFVDLLQLVSKRDGRILFLYNGTLARRRWAAHCFRQAAAGLGIEYEECNYIENVAEDLVNGVSHSYLIALALEPLIAREKYAAVICASDRSAMLAINCLKNRGYQVPEDIAVAGVGGVGFSDMTSPKTTTLRVDTTVLAARAVQLVGQQIRQEKIVTKTLLPVQVLRRQSL